MTQSATPTSSIFCFFKSKENCKNFEKILLSEKSQAQIISDLKDSEETKALKMSPIIFEQLLTELNNFNISFSRLLIDVFEFGLTMTPKFFENIQFKRKNSYKNEIVMNTSNYSLETSSAGSNSSDRFIQKAIDDVEYIRDKISSLYKMFVSEESPLIEEANFSIMGKTKEYNKIIRIARAKINQIEMEHERRTYYLMGLFVFLVMIICVLEFVVKPSIFVTEEQPQMTLIL